ncbi:hypothetical protein [Methanoculleus receptaculi]|jgi:hypothetical protein|uniref:Uncharacterized protein n=1 Tax=Methanoculleus receptaculi TaxID=394967 RepID=A0AAX4FUC2_9EURY|nr:hypothetical protein [Methanoculleus receptaculi]WOX57385.1 hypothetical protein R6Y96_08795 [Methanoculleus receptaculi]
MTAREANFTTDTKRTTRLKRGAVFSTRFDLVELDAVAGDSLLLSTGREEEAFFIPCGTAQSTAGNRIEGVGKMGKHTAEVWRGDPGGGGRCIHSSARGPLGAA